MKSPLLSTFAPLPIAIERGEDVWLIDQSGRRYLDLYGGHCVCLLGHAPQALVNALHDQASRLTFYSAALDLPQRNDAAHALLKLFPEKANFDRVFFANSGAEANENALKLAYSHSERRVVVAIEGAFHGRTAAVDPLCGGPARKAHYPASPFEVRWVAFNDAEAIREALAPGDVAAVIIEPVQSMAGCRAHSKEFVAALNEAAKASDTLVIADEVQGGFGRCLENFSFTATGLNADIVTMAKGLGAGFPVSALAVRSRVQPRQNGLFGSTFGGGPLALAAIKVVCEAITDQAFRDNVKATSSAVDALEAIPGLSLQGIGLLRGLHVGKRAKAVKAALLERGYIVGGSSNPETLRIMPPLTLKPKEVAAFGEALREIIIEGIE